MEISSKDWNTPDRRSIQGLSGYILSVKIINCKDMERY
jgi:hypothetical protein